MGLETERRVGAELLVTAEPVLEKSYSQIQSITKYWEAEQLLETTLERRRNGTLEEDDKHFYVCKLAEDFLRLTLPEGVTVGEDTVEGFLERMFGAMHLAGAGRYLEPLDLAYIKLFFTYMANSARSLMGKGAGEVTVPPIEVNLLLRRISWFAGKKKEPVEKVIGGREIVFQQAGDLEYGFAL